MRHTEIACHFGEFAVCNWLSRPDYDFENFEVSIVDHTGMDIIAYDPRTKRRLGITVKARIRKPGHENETVFVFNKRRKAGKLSDREKLLEACEVFGCEPWIAIYVECENYGDLYLTSLKNYDAKYKRENVATKAWWMATKLRDQYAADPEVSHIRLKFEKTKWPPLHHR